MSEAQGITNARIFEGKDDKKILGFRYYYPDGRHDEIYVHEDWLRDCSPIEILHRLLMRVQGVERAWKAMNAPKSEGGA